MPAGRAFAYVLETGLPLRDYMAVVTLTPTGGGTVITWRSTFRPRCPAPAGSTGVQLGLFIKQMVDGLATATDRVRTP